MGNYISFDRKKAEAYARTLRKRQQREQKEAENKFVMDQLRAEEVAKKIEATRKEKTESAVKVREPKPKPDHAAIALQRSLDIMRSERTFRINVLKGTVRGGDKETIEYIDTKHNRYLNRTAILAYHRYCGQIATGSAAALTPMMALPK